METLLSTAKAAEKIASDSVLIETDNPKTRVALYPRKDTTPSLLTANPSLLASPSSPMSEDVVTVGTSRLPSPPSEPATALVPKSVLKLVPVVPTMVTRKFERGSLDAFFLREGEVVDLTGDSVKAASGGSELASIFQNQSKKPFVIPASADASSRTSASAVAVSASSAALDVEPPLTIAGGVQQLRAMLDSRLIALGKTRDEANETTAQFPSSLYDTLGSVSDLKARCDAAVKKAKVLEEYKTKEVVFRPVFGFKGFNEITADTQSPRLVIAFKETVTNGELRGQLGSAKPEGYKPRSGRETVFGTDSLALTGDVTQRLLDCLPPDSVQRIAVSDVNLAVVPHSNTWKDPKTRSPFNRSSATGGFVACASIFNDFWDGEGVNTLAIFSKSAADAALAARKLNHEVFEFVLPVQTPKGVVNTKVFLAIKPSGEATLVPHWNHPQTFAQEEAGKNVSAVMIVACLAGDVHIDEASVARMCVKSALGGDGRLNGSAGGENDSRVLAAEEILASARMNGKEKEIEAAESALAAAKKLCKKSSDLKAGSADSANWGKFSASTASQDSLSRFIADCSKFSVSVTAKLEGRVVTILTTRSGGAGAGAGGGSSESVWDVVSRVATDVFGNCVPCGAAKGGSIGGHGHGSKDTVLLEHVSTGRLLVASRAMGPAASGTAFQSQRSVKLNRDSWESCGIKTKTQKNFEEPVGGFRLNTRVRLDGVLFEVVGFNANGWLTAWDAIVQRMDFDGPLDDEPELDEEELEE